MRHKVQHTFDKYVFYSVRANLSQKVVFEKILALVQNGYKVGVTRLDGERHDSNRDGRMTVSVFKTEQSTQVPLCSQN